MSSTPKHVSYDVYDEVRRDRDGWQMKYRQMLRTAQDLERELVTYKRQRNVVGHARPNPLDQLFKPANAE